VKRALFAMLIAEAAAAASADDDSMSAAAVCSTTAAVLADPQDDAALLQHLYGTTQRLRLRHALAEPATAEVAAAAVRPPLLQRLRLRHRDRRSPRRFCVRRENSPVQDLPCRPAGFSLPCC
jgi:hypothetical protein